MLKKSEFELTKEAKELKLPFPKIRERYNYRQEIFKKLKSINPEEEEFKIVIKSFTLEIDFDEEENNEKSILMKVYKDSIWKATLELPDYNKSAATKIAKAVINFITVWG